MTFLVSPCLGFPGWGGRDSTRGDQRRHLEQVSLDWRLKLPSLLLFHLTILFVVQMILHLMSRSNTAGVGQLLCESPLVAGISFTGSTQVNEKRINTGQLKKGSTQVKSKKLSGGLFDWNSSYHRLGSCCTSNPPPPWNDLDLNSVVTPPS